MLGLLDAFVGGAFSKASIFALGIMPHISAFHFHAADDHPGSADVKNPGKEGSGQKNQPMDTLSHRSGFCFPGCCPHIGYLKSPGNAEAPIAAYGNFSGFPPLSSSPVGTLFVMWLGEKITDKRFGKWYIHDHHDRYPARLPQAFGQNRQPAPPVAQAAYSSSSLKFYS